MAGTTNTVNIAGLTNAAKIYAPGITALPFYVMNAVTAALGIRILEVKGEHILVNRRRKAGILAPYKPGLTLGQEQEIIKFLEMKLKPERTYAEIVDNVTMYDDVKVISDAGNFVDNKTKKHPLELDIITAIVRSYAEDVVNYMFFAERDDTVKSPATAFNGFNMKKDALIAGGLISAPEKNLVTTGAFTNPASTTDTTPYEQLVSFVASADPFLRQGQALLRITEGTLLKARAGYKNKVKAFNDPTMAEMLDRIKDDARCPNLTIMTHPAYGSGGGLMLTAPGMLDFGVGSQSDDKFVQVRGYKDDPNDVQFWIQASYDARINDVHRKVFQVNEQVNTAPDLAGDYK
ncbi:MAG: hypothetical protein BGN96_13715 [Bacteroidales bacterium 45-6]|nr:MAG: hypothetical protein BGN96_13715 [Bacteroidales bacterium 45-6]